MSKRTDINQPEIVKALRKIGCTVTSLHIVGGGCPDIVVGYRKQNYLFEIKQPNLPPSKRLTPDEKDWHSIWQGSVHIVDCIDDAIKIVVRGY